ncbi:MAG: DUF4253 domain-containing protein [Phycisphaerales bacterium]|nr:DUF4253 domain-containing protein [Phycisphaerales bacterium]MCB9863395.1 DUF4253 domain-containing protein [Phycisphaerales bacterium]
MARKWNPEIPTNREDVFAVLDEAGLGSFELFEVIRLTGKDSYLYFINIDAESSLELKDRVKPVAAKRRLYPIITADIKGIWTPTMHSNPNVVMRLSQAIEATDHVASCDTWYRSMEDESFVGDALDGEWPDNIPVCTESYEIREAGLTSDNPRVALSFYPGTDAISMLSHIAYTGDTPQTELIIAYLRQWDARYGIDLISASSCSIELRVDRSPADRNDALKLARECMLLCPCLIGERDEILGFRCDNIHKLAAHLMGSTYWQFWWS